MAQTAAVTAKPLSAAAGRADKLPRVTQKLVAPPFAPAHDQVAKGGPKVVAVRMTTDEKLITIAPDGTKFWALTFNGTVPGPLIVVHEGDYVEVTLVNPMESTLSHNVDFHAATGALGGAELTLVQPSEEVVIRWKALKTGVFVYHCAPGGVMIPFHVISGMSGAIMVLPRGGLTDNKGKPVRYDRAYYIGEQDFYVPRDKNGKYKSYAQPVEGMVDMLELAKGLIPTHVVFNGAVGALTGANALKAKVGEKVLFIHSQANRDTRPHLIGGHGDLVWQGGSFNDPPITNQETWCQAYRASNRLFQLLLGQGANRPSARADERGVWGRPLRRPFTRRASRANGRLFRSAVLEFLYQKQAKAAA